MVMLHGCSKDLDSHVSVLVGGYCTRCPRGTPRSSTSFEKESEQNIWTTVVFMWWMRQEFGQVTSTSVLSHHVGQVEHQLSPGSANIETQWIACVRGDGKKLQGYFLEHKPAHGDVPAERCDSSIVSGVNSACYWSRTWPKPSETPHHGQAPGPH